MSLFHKDPVVSEQNVYLEKGILLMKHLISQKQYRQAMEVGDALFSISPNHGTVFRLYKKAQKRSEQQKLAKIREIIHDTKPLWKQKKYQELFTIYERLDQYLPHCSLVHDVLERIENVLEQKRMKEIADYLHKGLYKIRQLEKGHQYKKAVQAALEILETQDDDRVRRALFRNKRKYVDDALRLRHVFLKDKKYEELLHLYSRLLRVTPDYSFLHKLIRDCEQKILSRRLEEKQQFIQNSLVKLSNFFSRGQYGKLLQGSEELLKIDRHNLKAQWYRLIARFMNGKRIEMELADQMTLAWDAMGKEIHTKMVSFGLQKALKGIIRL
jgi:tetratricopeptide (TPR) repeat protein